MASFCTHFLELFMIPGITPEWTQENVVFHGEENYLLANFSPKNRTSIFNFMGGIFIFSKF